MVVFILIALIILSGFLAGLGKKKSLKIIQAFLLVSFETLLGGILFELLVLIFFMTPLAQALNESIGVLFLGILIIAIINGIILYWINHFLSAKFKISTQVQLLCEYMIQWCLIYVTVYQVTFDNLLGELKKEKFTASDINALNLTDPADLVIFVLPALISVWIALVLARLKKDTL